ncbi:MAG: hypothetical protein ABIP51_02600 [Bacteroidia bacterium]
MDWKKIASAFVTLDEPEVKKTDPSKPIKDQLSVPQNTVIKSYDSQQPVTVMTAFPGATINPDIKQHLLGLIKENNLDGLDYCEFSVQLETVKTFPIPIEQKYQTSFASIKGQAELSKQPFDKPKLLNSASYYKGVIQKAIDEFQSEFNETYKAEVEDKKTLVQSKAEQMKKLSEQMTALNNEIQELNISLAQSDSQLKVNKELFITTGNAVLAEIDSEIEKINSFIS